MALTDNIGDFNLIETKKKVSNYFMVLEKLEWEPARLNVQRGLVAKHKVADESKKQPYVVAGADEFNLSAKEAKAEKLKKHLSGYYWAKSILTAQEQLYITEYFVNDTGKLVELLSELERIRLELEYKRPDKVSVKC
jgi:hypothetical protein